MNYIDLFSGIGGFALGAYWADMHFANHYYSEIDRYCNRLYKKRFPDAKRLGNIKYYKHWKLAPGPYIVTGGFPCQPFSLAGKRTGGRDDRNLWPWMFRTIRHVRPLWVIAENVPGSFAYIETVVKPDLETEGYEVEIFNISGEAVGAPQKRARLWILAYANEIGKSQSNRDLGAVPGRIGDGRQNLADPDDIRSRGSANSIRTKGDSDCSGGENLADSFIERSTNGEGDRIYHRSSRRPIVDRVDWQDAEYIYCTDGYFRPTKPGVCLLVDGLPGRMDELKALGNSIVPEIAHLFFSVIRSTM